MLKLSILNKYFTMKKVKIIRNIEKIGQDLVKRLHLYSEHSNE